jgi:hypothetical protein
MQVGGRTFVRRSEVEAYVPDSGGRPRKTAAAKKKRGPTVKNSRAPDEK